MTWALKSGQLAVFGVKYKGSNYPVGTTIEMFPETANTCNTHFLRNNILPAYLKTSWFPLSGWCFVRKKHYSAVSRVLSQLLSLFPTAMSLKQLTWMPSHSSSILSEHTLNMIIKPSLKPVLILLLCWSHAFFWSCPSKRDEVYLCFLPSSRLQFLGTVWSGTVFPVPFTFAFCHSCGCCCCSLPQFDSSCQNLHLWSSS